MKERNRYFDFIKGLAILGVIAIHTVSTTFDANTFNGFVTVLIRQMLGCCVPVFVAASGYFLWKKSLTSIPEYKGFMLTRLKTLYVPMLIWSLPWLAMKLYASHSLQDVCFSIFFFLVGGLSIFYFITLIIEHYALLPVIQRVSMGGGNSAFASYPACHGFLDIYESYKRYSISNGFVL